MTKVGEKCMDYEIEAVNPRYRPKRSWNDVIEADKGNLKIKSMFASKWRRLMRSMIVMIVWVNV